MHWFSLTKRQYVTILFEQDARMSTSVCRTKKSGKVKFHRETDEREGGGERNLRRPLNPKLNFGFANKNNESNGIDQFDFRYSICAQRYRSRFQLTIAWRQVRHIVRIFALSIARFGCWNRWRRFSGDRMSNTAPAKRSSREQKRNSHREWNRNRFRWGFRIEDLRLVRCEKWIRA